MRLLIMILSKLICHLIVPLVLYCVWSALVLRLVKVLRLLWRSPLLMHSFQLLQQKLSLILECWSWLRFLRAHILTLGSLSHLIKIWAYWRIRSLIWRVLVPLLLRIQLVTLKLLLTLVLAIRRLLWKRLQKGEDLIKRISILILPHLNISRTLLRNRRQRGSLWKILIVWVARVLLDLVLYLLFTFWRWNLLISVSGWRRVHNLILHYLRRSSQSLPKRGLLRLNLAWRRHWILRSKVRKFKRDMVVMVIDKLLDLR